MLPTILKLLASASAVPVHDEPAAGCVVHQPPNANPGLASVPVLLRTVTDAPFEYAVASVGTEPLVAVLWL